MPSTLNLIPKGPTDLCYIIIIMNGVNLSLTDYHLDYRQNPTTMGSCHGGNVLGNLIGHSVIVKNVEYFVLLQIISPGVAAIIIRS